MSEKCCLHRSGCKGKGFSDNFQIFLNIFSKNFLKNLARLKHILHQSGCKVTSYFCNKQIIFKLFYPFFFGPKHTVVYSRQLRTPDLITYRPPARIHPHLTTIDTGGAMHLIRRQGTFPILHAAGRRHGTSET